jgi:hypothetical protein
VLRKLVSALATIPHIEWRKALMDNLYFIRQRVSGLRDDAKDFVNSLDYLFEMHLVPSGARVMQKDIIWVSGKFDEYISPITSTRAFWEFLPLNEHNKKHCE